MHEETNKMLIKKLLVAMIFTMMLAAGVAQAGFDVTGGLELADLSEQDMADLAAYSATLPE